MSLLLVAPPQSGQWRPQGVLTRYVDRFWWASAVQDESYEILPDGCVDLVLAVPEGADDAREGQWQLFGTALQSTPIRLQAGRYFGVRFKPGQARYFLPQHAAMQPQQQQSITQPLQGLAASPLRRPGGWLDATVHALGASAPSTSARVERIDRALHALAGSGGRLTIATLAEQSALSPRQLERLCLQATGVSPKWLARVTRFQAALTALQHGGMSLAAIAQQTGYADQAHLARDFRRFTGRAPSQQQGV